MARVVAPSLGPQEDGEVQSEGQGNFLTKKVGPLPMWAIIVGVLIVGYVLVTKFMGGQSSSTDSSQPAVQTNPSSDTSNALPWDNLNAALSQIIANEGQIQNQLTNPGTGSGTTGTTSSGTGFGDPHGPANYAPAKPVTRPSDPTGLNWMRTAPSASPNYGPSQNGTGTGTHPITGAAVATPTSARVPTSTPSFASFNPVKNRTSGNQAVI